ncbi:MAG: thioesterase family protein [Armatimonadetes bacterium]|nr:thioesterase family protein [Armatimonadota bacterium]
MSKTSATQAGPSHETTLRVRYAETDQGGVAYHGNYFAWFEVGRAALCRAQGFSYHRMETELGMLLPVADCACRFLKSALYDDVLTIRATITRLTRRTVTFQYQVKREGELLATGHTTHVAIHRDNSPASFPEHALTALAARV